MRRRVLLLSLLLSPLSACNDAIPNHSTPNALLPTVALADRMAYVEQNSHTAFLLDPASKTLVPRMVSVGKAPVAAVKRNGQNQLLVLSQGDPGSAQITPVAAELEEIDADASVAPVTYTLASRFNGLAQSPDGRFVLLYHGSSAQNSGESPLFNPNELAIVDLTLPPSAATQSTVSNPYAKSIRSLGGVPTGVVFSPSFTFASTPRILAVILAENYVTIVDMNNPDRTEITVPLSTDSNSTLSPAQVLFDTVNPNIYVLAYGSDDIFQISLTDLGAAAPAPPSNDFRVSLSILAAGTSPSDMALYSTGGSTRLAVLAPGSQTLAIIDPSTSSTTSIATSIPANQMVVFNTSSPSAPDQSEQQALLVDVSSGSTSVLFADLQSIETAGNLALVSYPLGASATSVVPLLDQGIVVLMYSQYSANALSVVDLAKRELSPIGAGSGLQGSVIDSTAPSRLWSIDSGAQYGLCYLNLVARTGQASLSTGEIWLDQNITNIIPLGQASSDGHRYLAVEQDDANKVGNVTLVDADNPDRTSARTAYGFLLTNYLERGQP